MGQGPQPPLEQVRGWPKEQVFQSPSVPAFLPVGPLLETVVRWRPHGRKFSVLGYPGARAILGCVRPKWKRDCHPGQLQVTTHPTAMVPTPGQNLPVQC